MSNDNTQGGAEPSPASAGSHGSPVVWALMQPDSYAVFASRTIAEKMQETCGGGDIIPLYRQPQPVLTDEERDVLDRLAHDASYRRMEWTERVVRGLLARLT